MAILIGAILAVAVCLGARAVGFSRDQAFFPLMTIVIASYYCLFAAIAGSGSALWLETALAAVFAAVAVVGFRTSLWLVAAALIGHGAMDLVHGRLIDNPGVPPWWPEFCSAFDIVAGAYLGLLLLSGAPRFATRSES